MMRGGRLGGLLELRDQSLPRYQAQLDEMPSETLSETFSTAGLTLFTDINGEVPAQSAGHRVDRLRQPDAGLANHPGRSQTAARR